MLLNNGVKVLAEFRQYETAYHNTLLKYEGQEILPGLGRHHSEKYTAGVDLYKHQNNIEKFQLSFTTGKEKLTECTFATGILISNWSSESSLLMPACVYNGNRFESRKIPYSPKLLDEKDIGPDKPLIISDVPRLANHPGFSGLQERSGSLAAPVIGLYLEKTSKIIWIIFDPVNEKGDIGLSVRENAKRDSLHISLIAPLTREKYSYKICNSSSPSTDIPGIFLPGEKVHFSFEMIIQNATDKLDLYRGYREVRKTITEGLPDFDGPSFKEAFQVVKDKFNRQNWVEEHSYYSVGMRENFLQDWQTGWTGGLISTYPLWLLGDSLTRQRVIRNIEWFINGGITPSGYFRDSGEKGTEWYSGDIRRKHTSHWHLSRKSADGLYYGMKQLFLFKESGFPIYPGWEKALTGLARAFRNTFKKYRQTGQFIHNDSGDVIVGGSTSAAILPAGLCLLYQWNRKADYLEFARETGNHLFETFSYYGFSCGGPGDALQNPDSESGYGLLESMICLFETTGEKVWLERAIIIADYFSTWVTNHHYNFPPESDLGKMGAETRGSVWANTQNKHAAPGICTYSGQALLRLFHYTNEDFYARLLQEICLGITQYLSMRGRMVPGMEEGWMTERISTTDWNEGIGMIMKGSTWAETSLMLVAAEIPSIYTTSGKNFYFDPVIISLDGDNSLMKINSKKPAILKILNGTGNKNPWSFAGLKNTLVHPVRQGENIISLK